jgi:hypothetical protein
VSEAIHITQGNGAGHIYTGASGSDTPVLHNDVQQVLDGIPANQRGVNHGRCGLPKALSEALHAGDDPNGADAAAVLVRKNVNNPEHNFGVGPCNSCQVLSNHYGLNFMTGP